MIKNGKYFLPPPEVAEDFKQLFTRMTAAGVGLPVDRNGFPTGQWTPERLTKAICEIDANPDGVDLRTVQHWYEDNDKGISADNIRWLARIFGCGDPDDVREWQIALTVATRTLAEKRRNARRAYDTKQSATSQDTEQAVEEAKRLKAARPQSWRVAPAVWSEAIFENQSPFGLPLIVFVAAVALGLIAVTLNVHSVVVTIEPAPARQVGFLWAPNWTVVFLVVLPFYLAFVTNMLKRWKFQWRGRLLALNRLDRSAPSWEDIIASTSYSYWAVLFITVVVASGYNWTATHLVPLMTGNTGGWPVDWGRIAIIRPDIISVPSAIIFTGLVFLYNAICSYLFFSGLILLNVIVHDYAELAKASVAKQNPLEKKFIAHFLRMGVFRCVALGLIITILMKLQSAFLQSHSPDIVTWILQDIGLAQRSLAVFDEAALLQRSAPGFYYSFFCVLAIAGTFVHSEVRIRQVEKLFPVSRLKWSYSPPNLLFLIATSLLVLAYLLVGVVPWAIFMIATALALFVIVLWLSNSEPLTERGK